MRLANGKAGRPKNDCHLGVRIPSRTPNAKIEDYFAEVLQALDVNRLLTPLAPDGKAPVLHTGIDGVRFAEGVPIPPLDGRECSTVAGG